MSPILSPNADATLQHLQMLFGRALEGRIELTAIHIDRAGPRPKTRFFTPDELDEATAWAVETNSEPGWNMYVGAGLRREDVFPGKAAEDDDFLRTYAVWADADTPEQLTSARDACQASGARPFAQVITGRAPTKRAQFWFPLETPITDANVLRATVRGIATALSTDMSVCTAKQLMRLAGSLAWPKPNKPGRQLEVTEIVVMEKGARENDLEALARAFPPVVRGEGVAVASEPATGSLAGALAVRDLRSALAHLRSDERDLWIRLGHALKPLGDQGRGLWLEWSQTSDKYDAADAARVWDSFKPNHTDHRAVFAEAQRQGWVNPAAGGGAESAVGMPTSEQNQSVEVVAGEAPPVMLTAASLIDHKLQPRPWFVQDMIPGEQVTTLDGDGGLGKSTLGLQLGVASVTGRSWLGQPVQRGKVLYVAAEDDVKELHRRLLNICTHYSVGLEDLTDLYLWPLAEHDPALVTANRDDSLTKTVRWTELEAAVAALQPGLLVLDSRADVFGGNEVSRAQARSFIGMLRAMAVRGRLSILILAHPSLSGMSSGTGSSGSTHWRNAVRAAIYLTKPDDTDGLPNPDMRVLEVKKANYGPSGASLKLRWSVGSFVLADAPEGLGIPNREAAQAGVDSAFLRMLVLYNAQGRTVSDQPGQNFAPTVFAFDPAAGGYTNEAFRGAMNRLFASSQIAVEEVGPPSKRRRKLVRAFAQGDDQ